MLVLGNAQRHIIIWSNREEFLHHVAFSSSVVTIGVALARVLLIVYFDTVVQSTDFSRDMMSASRDPSLYIQDITKWLQLEGGLIHPAVEIVHSNDATGYSLQVRETHDVPEGSRIASCPSSLTMSVLSMERAENLWPEEFMSFFRQSPEVLTRFFLMEQFLVAENSFWHPYIRMLPQPADDALDTPMFYSPEDCVWIKGTNLEGTRKVRLEQWQQEYQKAVDLLKSSDITRYELLRENW